MTQKTRVYRAMHISDLKVGHKARILSLGCAQKAYRQRLIALGLLPGTEFVVLKMAPLGDPIEIGVRGFALSLRKAEAACLQIEAL